MTKTQGGTEHELKTELLFRLALNHDKFLFAMLALQLGEVNYRRWCLVRC